MAAVDQFLDDVREDGLDEAPASWKPLKTRSLATFVMAEHEARPILSCQPNVWGRPGGSGGDDCQNTVAELPSVILRRSSWLSKKIMPRSVPVSYRRFTSVSKPVQLQNLTGPLAICPGVRSSEP